jgi:hypothetical protein
MYCCVTHNWRLLLLLLLQVRDRLVESCQQLGVRFVYNASVEGLQPPQTPATAAAAAAAEEKDKNGLQESGGSSNSSSSGGSSNWTVMLGNGAKVSTQRVILSTGGDDS